MLRTIVFVGVAFSVLFAGCVSSRHRPDDASPFLATYFDGGQLYYQVQGMRYTSLTAAVSSVPEARRLIEDAESDSIWGIVLTSLGSTFFSLGTVELAFTLNESEGLLGDNVAAGAILFGGGLAAMIGGLALVSGAERDRLDGINVFNDEAFRRLRSGDPDEPGAHLPESPGQIGVLRFRR